MYPSLTGDVETDVIIIGGGISGMCAAYYIQKNDPSANILVLEATNRLGGRTLSIPLKIAKNNMRSFDIGGQFVAFYQTHIMDIVKRLSLKLSSTENFKGNTVSDLEPENLKFTFFNFEKLPGRNELRSFFKKITKMSKTVTFNNPHSIQDSQLLDLMTMEAFLTENLNLSSSKDFVKHVIRTTCGLEASHLSVLFYLAQYNSTNGLLNDFLISSRQIKKTWIKGGADQICYKIANIIGWESIETNSPVQEIMRYGERVLIRTTAKIYVCNYAIIAIPPKEVLDITFTPSLPQSRFTLLSSLETGHLIKFVVTFKTAFWKEKGFTGSLLGSGKEKGPIHICYDVTDKDWPALAGYITSADCLDQPVDTYKNAVLKQLARYFGNEALDPLDYYEKSWLNEPYIYHCIMNNPGFGNMERYHEIKRPLGRLFWAGTETATCWNGYINGAVQAGYRAAVEVLYEFRPQSLSVKDIEFITPRQQRQSNALVETLVNYGTSWKVYFSVMGFFLVLLYLKRRK